jgi:hypothetical protein
MESVLVITWAGSQSPRYRWFIRGLRQDGSFYGEVRSTFDSPRESDGASGVDRGIEGQLSSAEMDRVCRLAALIRSNPMTESVSPVIGTLADGPINEPTVLYRHTDCRPNSPTTQAFLDIIAILQPHLSTHYPTLV